MGQLSQEDINTDLFNEVVRLKSELAESKKNIDRLEKALMKIHSCSSSLNGSDIHWLTLEALKDKNSYYEERYRLIEADVQFSSIPRPDYSKMTNEQIAKRTEMIDQTFEWLFSTEENHQ
ncbi:hypothetical protein LG291_25725 (plasmid) [Cytobacillus firmus]|uniref:Uncharacterized protein n=1 Tax=Cytobacillus firmus DS1 TaxID=1307436 RepID=W7LAE9_CYTFI|nr:MULTISPECIES: hypothetical protein [Bacillaceae]EWG08804.1 hypothetical protein PBF_22477 [Cytobacillus firmus DS1]